MTNYNHTGAVPSAKAPAIALTTTQYSYNAGDTITMTLSSVNADYWSCIGRLNCDMTSYGGADGTTTVITLAPTPDANNGEFRFIPRWYASFGDGTSTPPTSVDENITEPITFRTLLLYGGLPVDELDEPTFGAIIYASNGNEIINLTSSLNRFVMSGTGTLAASGNVTITVPGVDWDSGEWEAIVTLGGTEDYAQLIMGKEKVSTGIRIINYDSSNSRTYSYWVFRQ